MSNIFSILPFILERLISVGQATRYKKDKKERLREIIMESSLRPMFILLAAMCVAKYATDYSRYLKQIDWILKLFLFTLYKLFHLKTKLKMISLFCAWSIPPYGSRTLLSITYTEVLIVIPIKISWLVIYWGLATTFSNGLDKMKNTSTTRRSVIDEIAMMLWDDNNNLTTCQLAISVNKVINELVKNH